MQKRTFGDLNFSVMIIDGTMFKEEHHNVAIDVDCAERKLVLGLRQGFTDNAPVVLSWANSWSAALFHCDCTWQMKARRFGQLYESLTS